MHMAFRCAVCKHPDISAINVALVEGVGTREIVKDYGLTINEVNNHRMSGHAGRAITEAIISSARGPLSEEIAAIARISISSKAWRMQELQWLYERCKQEVEHQTVGTLDPKLVAQTVGLLMTGAKEQGEWTPSGSVLGGGEGGPSITVNHFSTAAGAPARTLEHAPGRTRPNPAKIPQPIGIIEQLEHAESTSDSCKSGKLESVANTGGFEVAGPSAAAPGAGDSQVD